MFFSSIVVSLFVHLSLLIVGLHCATVWSLHLMVKKSYLS